VYSAAGLISIVEVLKSLSRRPKVLHPRQLLPLLCDGGFKLLRLAVFARQTGYRPHPNNQSEMARALGKSKQEVGRWTAELYSKRGYKVEAGRNQYDRTRFQIRDRYWPYHRSQLPTPQ
jgi:hypothetical protein